MTASPFHRLAGQELAESVLPPDVTIEQVSQAVRDICLSEPLNNSPNLQRFLQYAVEMTLSGRGGELKEYSIAVSVFGRKDDFDPRTASIVRTQAGKLRQKLAQYYATSGRNAAVYIVFSRGSYVPKFQRESPSPDADGTTAVNNLPGAVKRDAIVVLPLECVNGSEQLKAMTAIATHELSNALSHVHAGGVISNLTSSQLRSRFVDTRTLAAAAGAAYVVEGDLYELSGRVAMRVRLINGMDGVQICSVSREATPEALDDDLATVTRGIADEIAANLRRSPLEPVHTPPVDPRVQQMLDNGRFLLAQLSINGTRSAVRMLQSAIQTRRDFVEAQARLALCHVHTAMLGLVPRDRLLPAARAAAAAALAGSSYSALAKCAFLTTSAAFELTRGPAFLSWQEAVAANAPSEIQAYRCLFQLVPEGEISTARRLLQACLKTPGRVDTFTRYAAGWCAYNDGAFGDAIEHFREILDLEPDSTLTLTALCRVLIAKQERQSAMLHLKALARQSGAEPIATALKGHLDGVCGDKETAYGELARLRSLRQNAFVPLIYDAYILASTGDIAIAARILEQELLKKEIELLWVGSDPIWTSLRGHELFHRLVGWIGCEFKHTEPAVAHAGPR